MRSVFILLFCVLVSTLQAQPQIGALSLKSETNSEITSVSVDRLGNFYLAGSGTLVRLDPEGKPSGKKIYPQREGTNLLECWNPLRIWHYQESFPFRAILLDNTLETLKDSIQIDPAIAIKPLLIAPAVSNNNCWILDMDYSVKYLNLTTSTVMLDSEPLVAPGTNPGFLYMRAYQNLLFLLTREKGILVMNMTGHIIRTIPVNGVSHFGVLGEDIYFRRGKEMVFINLYSGDETKTTLPEVGEFILANDERLLIASGKKYSLYRFSPPK